MFCKNRDRLLDGDIAAKFFAGVLNLPQVGKLLSSEHFSVDGTLLEAWASMKSFVPKSADKPPAGKGDGGGRNAERDFHGEKRRNDTHSSTTDPDARLFCKGAGKEAIGLIRRSDDGAEHWKVHVAGPISGGYDRVHLRWCHATLEERDLIRVFGDEYPAYRKRVEMLIPWRKSS